MFDPTAFENMKVVLEGAVYDRDLVGDILVIGRDDIVNLSTMARQYSIKWEMKGYTGTTYVCGGFLLNASLKNLSSELLEGSLNDAHAGCTVDLFILIQKKLSSTESERISKGLEKIWGSQRIISMTTTETFRVKEQPVSSSRYDISFGRLIKEEQMDDLEDMIEYLIQSMQLVEDSVNG